MSVPKCVRSQDEIDRVLNFCCEGDDGGSAYPGMSYEQGLRAALEWLLGQTDDAPDE